MNRSPRRSSTSRVTEGEWVGERTQVDVGYPMVAGV
jgi:hypothetical protein